MAVDRQDTGPEGGAADGGKLDRLEVVAVWGRRWELRGEEAKDWRWRSNSGVYQFRQPESSSEGRGVTAMKAAPGQRMGGSGGGGMGGFSSCGRRLGPPRSGGWTMEGGGVEGGEKRAGACQDPGRLGTCTEERRGRGSGKFQTIERRGPGARVKERDPRSPLTSGTRLGYGSLKCLHARTGQEEGKGFEKTTVKIHSNKRIRVAWE